MNRRFIMQIDVFSGVPGSLASVTDRVGSTQVSVISRLLEWFVNQSDVTQAAILGLYPGDIRKELPKVIIDRMRVEKLKPSNLPPSSPVSMK
jgi:hypothetical protein